MAEIRIVPPKLHAGQVKIWGNKSRLNAVSCGRRFGKTKLLVWLAARTASKGMKFGIFAPEHKQLLEPWNELKEILQPIITSANKNEGTIRCKGGGQIDFWALNDNELAGRGREYDAIACDEIAFAKDNQMTQIWERSIKPTLLTTKGSAWMFSTPNGENTENFFWQICCEPDRGWTFHHAPTRDNPYVPQDELDKEKRVNHELVWLQEFEAKFISWDSATFFKLDFLLKDGKPVECNDKVAAIYAVMDCAVKSGTDNDATAVVYFALNVHYGHPVIILDWDMYSIEAASLEYLAPQITQKCEDLAKQYRARAGSQGLFVEDAAGGSILLQKARAEGWNVHSTSSKLLMKGKDERSFAIGGQVSSGMVKISTHAFEKTQEWKGRTANHLIRQITSFRIGDKEAYKREDDLLDCFAYGVAMGVVDQYAINI
jgi:hypothetical protein